MKTLKNKSEITAKNLKEQDCDYKGHRLGYDKDEKMYFIGRWFNAGKDFWDTIEEIKYCF